MGQMMPPPQIGTPRPRGWREQWMRRFGMDMVAKPLTKGEYQFPNWLVNSSMAFFFVSMFVCWGVFGYVPAFDLILVSCISVVLFFYGGSMMSNGVSRVKEKRFIREIYIWGLVLRLLWFLYVWFFFNLDHYGAQYGEMADVDWYIPFGKELAQWLKGDSEFTLAQIIDHNGAAIDDAGYPMWLAVGYTIWGEWSDAFIPMLIKCVVGAYCSVCVYRISKRHFSPVVARMAAIFVCLNPNMIYWCGNMFKESELVFLTCLALDNFDRVLMSGKKYTFRSLLPGMLAAIALMFFRSVLSIMIFLAVFAHIVMASRRVMSTGKKILAGVFIAVVLAVSMGDRIRTQSRELVETIQSDKQQVNMEWRSRRKDGGNTFAKYAGAAVFAPLIFTIPFPTFNMAAQEQLLQMQLSGGSYIKNIFSFFVILVMILMLISGEWRRHVFIIAYTIGYLLALVMSNFAQSGRFHMPVIPMLMIFAAYGIQIAKNNSRVRKWFPVVLVIEVFVCLAWNWFKLKGRGMI